MAEQQQQPPEAAARDPFSLPLVSAGESEHDSSDQDMKQSHSMEEEDEEEPTWKYGDPNQADGLKPDDLFDENADEENEAWVYKHRRGGTEETVTIKKPQSSKLEQAKLLKPRNSDAVLSCPCCFEIVCMDCQQHEKYSNQYRAMFVMNIGVDWRHELVYDAKTNGLVDKPAAPTHQVPPEQENQQQVYFSVHCHSCHTQVAALDMTDEVYHFFGCLSSA